jgi:hypothetical protein
MLKDSVAAADLGKRLSPELLVGTLMHTGTSTSAIL